MKPKKKRKRLYIQIGDVRISPEHNRGFAVLVLKQNRGK